jgi:hypothetical protein
MLATHGPSAASRSRVWSSRRLCLETSPPLRPVPLIASAPEWGSRSRRMPRQSLDAPEDLPKQAVRQVTFGKRQGEVPGMPDEASAGLEEPLLEARERPVLDGQRQGQPMEQIAEVVGDDSQEQADLIRPEAVAGEEPGQIARRPSGGALRVSEGPLRAASLAGAERLSRDSFRRQMENVG